MNRIANYTFFLLLAMLTTSTLALAGKEKGGGGGISINGQFYTLAQAGLKLDPTVRERYFLDAETLEAVDALLKRIESFLPQWDKNTLRHLALGPDHIYKRLTVVSPSLFSEIKDSYRRYVDSLDVQGEFQLIAYTDSSKVTYLLPEWEKASPEARALFLVTHEAPFFKDINLELDKILKFESAVYNLNSNPQSPEFMWETYKTMVDLGIGGVQSNDYSGPTAFGPIKYTNDLRATYYIHYLKQKGITLKLKNLLSFEDMKSMVVSISPKEDGSYLYTLVLKAYTDTLAVSRSRGIDKDFIEIFGEKKLILFVPKSYCKHIRDSYTPGLERDKQIAECVNSISELEINVSYEVDAAFIQKDGAYSKIHFVRN